MAIKINFVVRLQHWMDSVPGQTFLNYAYSWGAAIVILGALFKLTHLPGGNLMLFIGMGTEVVVFTLSAFDRPFDKSEVGRELPPDYETDEEIAARLGLSDEEEGTDDETDSTDKVPQPTVATAPAATGPAIVLTAGPAEPSGPVATAGQPLPAEQQSTTVAATPAAASQEAGAAAIAACAGQSEVEQLASLIRAANDELLRRAQATLAPEMEAATQTYVEKLQALTETFARIDEQNARLTKDSAEMENLNRTLTGINKVYELHLKSISLQVGTIDQINGETHKLAQQIEELNRVYGRMIEALTVNMRGSAPAATGTPPAERA